MPCVARVREDATGAFVADVPNDGFRAAVFFHEDASGDATDADVTVLAATETTPASRHAFWKDVSVHVQKQMPAILDARRDAPKPRHAGLLAAILLEVAKARAVVAETADPADVDAAVVDPLVRQACSTPSPSGPAARAQGLSQ